MQKINNIINTGNYKLKLVSSPERIIDCQIQPEQFKELFLKYASERHYFKGNMVYVVDKDNQKIINYLYQYLTGDEDFDGNLHRGIILVGKIGCGKTLMMDIFIDIIFAATEKVFTCMHSKEVETEMTKFDIVHFAHRPLFIDDIGKEEEQVKDYGTVRKPFEDLISYRYGKPNILFGTSNLTLDDMNYSLHTKDRLREICNIVELPGNSRRK